MEDKQIVEMLFQRKESAIHELDEKYRRYCNSIAWHILGNREDAEECVNDTWYQAWRSIPPQRPGSLQAFVGKITRGFAIDKIRKKSAARRPDTHFANVEQETAELNEAWYAIEKAMEAKELTALLNQFLVRLSEEDRDVFVRRYWFMDSLEEIAVRHSKSVGSIRGNLYRSRKKLQAFLKENEVAL